MLDISKVVMQRTLDVILTTANSKSAHGVDGERRRQGNENMRYAKSVEYEPKRSSRAPKFPQLEGRIERGKF